MERTLTAERVEPFAKVSGNPALDGPKRGSNPEAGQLSGWQKPHAAARHLDCSGVLRQVAELIDGLLVLRFWLSIGVGEAKRSLAKARDPVGHRDLARERLQGIQPLIRILHFGLQLHVLLFEV